MRAPVGKDDRRALRRDRWRRAAVFVVFLLVLAGVGVLIFKSFLGAHLVGSTD